MRAARNRSRYLADCIGRPAAARGSVLPAEVCQEGNSLWVSHRVVTVAAGLAADVQAASANTSASFYAVIVRGQAACRVSSVAPLTTWSNVRWYSHCSDTASKTDFGTGRADCLERWLKQPGRLQHFLWRSEGRPHLSHE